MKKATIDIAQTMAKDIQRVLNDVKENIEIVTGRRGGAIGLSVPRTIASTGLAVNTAAATLVTTKVDFDALIVVVRDIQEKLNLLITRLNTP